MHCRAAPGKREEEALQEPEKEEQAAPGVPAGGEQPVWSLPARSPELVGVTEDAVGRVDITGKA